MGNEFSKQETVAFETMVVGFNDALVFSKSVKKYTPDSKTLERSGDAIWRPQPYIMTSYDGRDQTANFKPKTQLSVPSTIGYEKSSPWTMTATELIDSLQEGRLGRAAAQKLASDVNIAVTNQVAFLGGQVVKIVGAAGDYGDLSLADSLFNEIGVNEMDRFMGLNTRDYNGLADNLAVATRSFGNPKSDKAYERNYVGPVAGFDTYKLAYSYRLAAAGGGGALTISTLDAAANYYVPRATSTSALTGQRSNVDNRFQTITISSTVGVAAGDCFTIADLNAVHAISKQDTGQLKTFRVVSVDSATTMTITPPIITNQVENEASKMYQNCVINTKAANSAIVFLNTAASAVNPFWHYDAVEIMPGRYNPPENSGASIMRASLDNGIEFVLAKQFDINTYETKFRADIRFGVTVLQPEMCGILLFNQV